MDEPQQIGFTAAESTPRFPREPKPPQGAPNVVAIVLDDTGFGHLGAFGSDIGTPHLDALAAGGAPFNRFHVTSLCSPTRASFFTGRNHHAVGMGFLADIPLAFPGYDARLPKSAATLPRLLRDAGYSTMAVGKWHLTPRWQRSAAGPFDTWPLGLGFERYYGFLQGDTNHWTPNLVCDNHYIEPPAPARGGLPPERGPGRPGRPHGAGPAAGGPGQAVLPVLRARRHARPAPRGARVGRPLPGVFDKGWDAWRAEVFARQLATGMVPEGTVLTERPEWVQALGRPPRRGAAHARPPAGGLRRLPDPHRRADRPGPLVAREPGCTRQHPRHGLLRQRRQRRGRQGRQRQRAPLHRAHPRVHGPTTWPTTTTGAGSAPTTTTRGPGPGPATPRTSSGSATPGWAGPARR